MKNNVKALVSIIQSKDIILNRVYKKQTTQCEQRCLRFFIVV